MRGNNNEGLSLSKTVGDLKCQTKGFELCPLSQIEILKVFLSIVVLKHIGALLLLGLCFS